MQAQCQRWLRIGSRSPPADGGRRFGPSRACGYFLVPAFQLTRTVKSGVDVAGPVEVAATRTLAQLMKATGWQAHSVRGFLSGALGKKMGLKIESQKQENGERAYSVKD